MRVRLSLFALAFLFGAGFAHAAESPEAILEKTDAIRNPGDAFVMTVEVTSTDDELRRFEVAIKGKSKTHVRTLLPARDKGRDLLMIDENMWAFVPNLKRAVRVNLSQKLSGQAANGDISRMRWAGDYAPKVESESDDEWTLFLTAAKKGLTYEKIRARVAKGSYRPIAAEYLTADGKPLKKATFGAFKRLAGGERPSQIVIEDAVRPDRKSTIQITEMLSKPLSESLFSLEKFGAR